MLFGLQLLDQPRRLGEVIDRAVGRAGQHERGHGLVDHHRIRLVDDGDVEYGADPLGLVDREAVAQHVESDLADA